MSIWYGPARSGCCVIEKLILLKRGVTLEAVLRSLGGRSIKCLFNFNFMQ